MLIPRLFLGAIRGGSGKTLITLGITALLSEKGLRVATFKKGPDYIDAGWLSVASKQECHNLDPYLMDRENILASFYENSKKRDISIIEGNRGLFDSSHDINDSSSANLAKMLSCPFILALDCTKMTKTAAAIVLGVLNFDRDLILSGVILNNIGSHRQEITVRNAIEYHTGIKVMGAVPRLKFDPFPMRHLGVQPIYETINPPETINRISFLLRDCLDLEGLLQIARDVNDIEANINSGNFKDKDTVKDVNIGVLMDEAFQFYYPENLKSLKKAGANLIFINALKDNLPKDIHALYIGGGFPETNAPFLASNISLKNALKNSIENGLPVYAECGGLMYLGKFIEYQGQKYEMLGIIPYNFRLEEKPVGHGYSEMLIETDNIFYNAGDRLKGHEFHYSRPVAEGSGMGQTTFSGKMIRGKGFHDKRDGVIYKNVFGSYTHIHSLTHPEWADKMARAAKSFKMVK